MHVHVGTKNVAKEMAKISQGKVKDKGKTWFPELVDKRTQFYCDIIMYMYIVPIIGKSIKTHLYWAMKNCNGNSETLRELIDSIPKHYQVS